MAKFTVDKISFDGGKTWSDVHVTDAKEYMPPEIHPTGGHGPIIKFARDKEAKNRMNYIKRFLVFVARYFTSWALTCGIALVLFKIFHATFDIRFVSGVWLILALFDKFVRLGQEPLEVREHEQL